MKIRGVLFDKDGTLFDFTATWAGWVEGVIDALAGQDAVLARQLAWTLGWDAAERRLRADSMVIASTLMEIVVAIHAQMPGRSTGALLAELTASAAEVRPVPVVPLPAFLDGLLGQGLRLGIATNDGEAPARVQLDRLGVTRQFHFIAGFDSGHGAKPGPGMCDAFARTQGLRPDEVVMVGDSLHDLHAGRAAGMRTIAVLTGIADAATLAPHADAVLPDIGHLPAWLAR